MNMNDSDLKSTTMKNKGNKDFNEVIGTNVQARILNALKRGNRVEIVPIKNGVRVLEIKREVIE